jgi:regulator of replication initiation timing
MDTISLLFQLGLEQKIVDLEQEVSRLKQKLQERKEQAEAAELDQDTAQLRQDTEGSKIREQQVSREPSSSPTVLSPVLGKLKVSIINWLKEHWLSSSYFSMLVHV